jgi:hypothetical protein
VVGWFGWEGGPRAPLQDGGVAVGRFVVRLYKSPFWGVLRGDGEN